MKTLILVTTLLAITAYGKPKSDHGIPVTVTGTDTETDTVFRTLEPTAVSMNFTYVPHEAPDLPNAGQLECKHERIRDLPDWKVICGDDEKQFTAHVVLRIGKRSEEPKTVIEILYWVTAPGETPTSIRKYHSTSALVYLNEPTDMAKLNISQGVENDMASLTMVVEKK